MRNREYLLETIYYSTSSIRGAAGLRACQGHDLDGSGPLWRANESWCAASLVQ